MHLLLIALVLLVSGYLSDSVWYLASSALIWVLYWHGHESLLTHIHALEQKLAKAHTAQEEGVGKYAQCLVGAKPNKDVPENVRRAFVEFLLHRLEENGNEPQDMTALRREFVRYHGPGNLDLGILRPGFPPCMKDPLS